MKKTTLMFAVFAAAVASLLPAASAQTFDFTSLDRLNALAKNKTNVTLDGGMLKLAAGFLGNDPDSASIKGLVDGLKGIYVRTWEFERTGQYSDADLAPLRAYLKQPPWNRIVESVENGDASEVWLQPLPNNQLGGIAVISAAPKELTVVYISGVLNMNDIRKLGGNLGIPNIDIGNGTKKPGTKSVKKKDDEQ